MLGSVARFGTEEVHPSERVCQGGTLDAKSSDFGVLVGMEFLANQ